MQDKRQRELGAKKCSMQDIVLADDSDALVLLQSYEILNTTLSLLQHPT